MIHLVHLDKKFLYTLGEFCFFYYLHFT